MTLPSSAASRRGPRAASALAVLTLGATGALVAAVPAAADVTGFRVTGSTASWDCASPLPSNPAWVIGSTEYGISGLSGAIAAGSPFEVDLGPLGSGSHTAHLTCVYVPTWNSTGSHRTYASHTFTYTAPVTAPGAPTSLTATPGDGEVRLDWAAPASTGGEAVTYTVTRSPGGQVATGLTATGYAVTGLDNGTDYTFAVTATNSAGTGPAADASATPVQPDATVALTVSPTGTVVGADVTVTASVTAGGAAVTDGTVRLTLDGSTQTFGVVVVDGTAIGTFTLPEQAGEVTFRAAYSGGALAGPASATAVHRVEAAVPVVTLDAPATAVVGAPFTMTATVTGDLATPEGDVQLIAYRDGVPPVVVNATLAGGSASGTFDSLEAGAWTVLAHYSGSSTQGTYQQADSSESVLLVEEPPADVDLDVPATATTPVGTPATLTVGLPEGRRPATLTVSGPFEPITVAVPATGPVRVTLPVLTPGTHRLTVQTPADDAVLAASAQVELTVAGKPAMREDGGTGVVTGPQLVAADARFDVAASGFAAGETVVFYWSAGAVLLGTAVADADGVARRTVQVPAGVDDGGWEVQAVGGTSGRYGALGLSVMTEVPAPATPPGTPTTPAAPATEAAPTARPTSPARGTLAATGSDVGGLLAIQALLLVAGLGAVLVRRHGRA